MIDPSAGMTEAEYLAALQVESDALTAQKAELELSIRAAQAERDMLEREILSERRGGCWCEMGIGNPMVRRHSDSCEWFQEWFEARL